MRNLILICMLISGLTAGAQYKGYKPVADINGFKSSFTAASQKIRSIRSDFVQEKNLSLLSEKIVSRGKFWFRKENMVRMEYQHPFSYLMIISGNDVYVKDGQKENKVSTKSNKLFQKINRLTVDCVQGTVFTNPDFTVKAFENSQQYLVEMIPVAKGLTDFFSRILVTVDRKDFSVANINMMEQGGDNTLIIFQQKEINVSIADAVFAHK